VRVLGDDRGAVTVEAALALCSVVAVMVMVIAAVSAASAHLRCLDAAREAARLVSRGEPQRAQEIATAVAPRGATVDVRVSGDEVDVRVIAAAVPGIPGLSLVGVAVAVMEPAAFLSAGAPPDSMEPLSEGSATNGSATNGSATNGSVTDGSAQADSPADPSVDATADPPADAPVDPSVDPP
jgi:hypothetical protein